MLERLLRWGTVPVAALSLVLPSCSIKLSYTRSLEDMRKEVEDLKKINKEQRKLLEKEVQETLEQIEKGIIHSPINTEEEKKVYSGFFDYLENQGVDFFVDSLIDDLRDVGEHGGLISFEGSNFVVEKFNSSDDYFRELKETISDLKQGKIPEDLDQVEQLIKIKKLPFESKIIETIRNNPRQRNYLLDWLIFSLDGKMALCEAELNAGNEDQIDYHFHPIPAKLSSQDLYCSWFMSNKHLPLAVSYQHGDLVFFYHENSQHKSKRFPVESDEKKFHLNLLMAKNYSQCSFVLFSEDRSSVCNTTFKGDRASETISYLKDARAQIGNDFYRRSLFKSTVHGILQFLELERVYLQDNLSEEKLKRFEPMIYNLKFTRDLENLIGKPKAPPKQNNQRFPWEIPAVIGISTLAMLGADRYINRKQYQYRKRNR